MLRVILVTTGLYVGLTMGNHSIAVSRQENCRTFNILHFFFVFQSKITVYKTEKEKVLALTKLVHHTKSINWSIFYKTGISKAYLCEEKRNDIYKKYPNQVCLAHHSCSTINPS